MVYNVLAIEKRATKKNVEKEWLHMKKAETGYTSKKLNNKVHSKKTSLRHSRTLDLFTTGDRLNMTYINVNGLTMPLPLN